MSLSSILVILVAAVVLIIILKIVTGLLRLGISLILLALLAYSGYWLYLNIFVDKGIAFQDAIKYIIK